MEREIRKIDAVIVGGGPAGLSAAVALHRMGIRDLLVVERERHLGGILRQCIHDGFGLTRFGTSMSGPEYAQRFIDEVERRGIPFLVNATVADISGDRLVTVVTREGILRLQAGAVVLAMGCRERTRGALAIPGERPAGVYTAGVAQAYMNLYNRMPAREAVILGSGDIGMIMARRLTLEGVRVKAVFEVQPYPSGLARNIEQCLNDYGIPLYLSRTVTEIHGDARITGVTVSRVDEGMRPIPGTGEYWACDTLILSVGLIPENELTMDAGAVLDARTKGASVSQFYETTVPGIFAAGNVLHVHDLVDFVSLEAEDLAGSVERFLREGELPACPVEIRCGRDIGHTVPMRVTGRDSFRLSLRVSRPMRDVRVVVARNGKEAAARFLRKAVPAEMIEIEVKGENLTGEGALEVYVE